MADPVVSYFTALLEDVERYAVDAFDEDAVITETRSHGDIPTATLMMLGGPVLKPVFRLLVSRLVGIMTGGQQDAVMRCAGATAEGTITEAEGEAGRERFLDEARPLLDRLNEEAEEAIEQAMRDAFPRLIRHTAVFMEADGSSFEERLRTLPRDEAEEHLTELTAYIGSIREAVEECNHVTVSVSPPGIPISILTVHVRSELLRVLAGARDRIEERVAGTVEEAFTGE